MNPIKLSPSGIVMALISVMLISSAQLAMKWGMGALQASSVQLLIQWQQHIACYQAAVAPLLAVVLGLCCYALSMVCWVMALKKLPLSIAYPLLSLSYVVVYLAAVSLPWLNETLSWEKGLGIVFILLGLVLVLPKKQTEAE